MCSPTASGGIAGWVSGRARSSAGGSRPGAGTVPQARQRAHAKSAPNARGDQLKTYPFIRLLTANAHVCRYDHKCVAMPRGNRAVIPVRCHGHSSLRDATMQAEERVALHLPVGISEISLAYQRSSRCGSTPGSSRTTAMKSRSCLYPPASGRQEARREECPC